MRKRLEVLLLGALVLAVAAFAGSALLGVRQAQVDRGPASGARAEQPSEPRFVGGRIRVEVLNGAGTAGLAREATDRLRDAGFDVVYFGNASEFGEGGSAVIDRSGEPRKAEAVAKALGITNVVSSPDPELLLEATVVLGEDWPPQRDAEPRSRADRLRDALAFWRD